MNIDYKRYVKYIGLFLIVSLVSFQLLNKYVFNNPVFSFSPSESQTTNWIQKLTPREKRNIKAMNKSYDLLMNLGSYALASEDWNDASRHYFYAKTLFPDRIESRKQLCYSYFMLCQEDWRACEMGKKELYYAMKYVDPNDQITYNYLQHLVDLADLNDIVDLDEGEALSAIY